MLHPCLPLVRTRLAALALLVALTACGEEGPEHGLAPKELSSAPAGDALEASFAIEDGAAYRARIELTMDVRSTQRGAPTKQRTRSGRAVLAMTWRFRRSSPDAPAASDLTLKYVEAEGANAEAFLAQPEIRGTLRHGSDGRVLPRSLTLEGGRRDEQLQAHDLLGKLFLAGFGGSPPWTPPRAIRRGEAWSLEAFMTPRAVDNVARYARDVGLSTPEPTFEGTARLVDLVPGDREGESWLVLELSALISIDGAVSKGGERGRLSVGDRTNGRATVSATTGIPRTFDVEHVRRTEVQSGRDRVEVLTTSRIRGRVERTAP